MILPIIFIIVSQTSFVELESLWWDCDVKLQQGQLINQEHIECEKLNREFRKHFWDEYVFGIYWHTHKKEQWAKRGYFVEEHND